MTLSSSPKKNSRWFWIFPLTLILIAATLRLWGTDTLPSGLYPDESVNAIDAIGAIESGHYQLFYPNNNGREGLFINLQSLALQVFGYHTWSLRLFSGIFGTLTVLGIYLLALELWHKRSIALVAAFLTTFSYWAINFSRIGFRAIMVPFILTFTFYSVFRGLRTKTLLPFFVAGLVFGLGLHTYIAFRIAPLVFFFLFVGLLLSFGNFLRTWWKHILIFLLGAMLTAAPLLIDFAQHPEYLSSRSASISIFDPAVNQGHFFLTLAETVSLSLVKYTFWGDQNWRHNYPPYPNLDPFTGILFLLGFVFLVGRVISLARRQVRDHRDRNREFGISLFLLGWFFCMLVPEFLTHEGLPHSLRSIGTLPVVFLIAALPFLWIGEWYVRATASTRLALGITLSVLFLTIASWNTIKYFSFFAHNPNQHGAFNHNFTNMATYLRSLPAETHKYVYANAGGTMIHNNLPVTAQPVIFLTYQQVANLNFVMPDTPLTIQTPAVIIPMNFDENFIQMVQSQYPQATTENIDLAPNTQSNFTLIHIP